MQGEEVLFCDKRGYFDVEDIAICLMNRKRNHKPTLKEMVANILRTVQLDEKGRFEVLVWEERAGAPEQEVHAIRAVSGWAFPFIDLNLAARRINREHLPMLECLVHKTHAKAVPAILSEGLVPGGTGEGLAAKRTHVMMSAYATSVGPDRAGSRSTAQYSIFLDIESLLDSNRMERW